MENKGNLKVLKHVIITSRITSMALKVHARTEWKKAGVGGGGILHGVWLQQTDALRCRKEHGPTLLFLATGFPTPQQFTSAMPQRYSLHVTRRDHDGCGMGWADDDFMSLQDVLKFLNPVSFSIFKYHFRDFCHIIWTPIEITRQNAEFCSVLK